MAAADVFARIRKGPQMMTGDAVRHSDLGFNVSKRVTRQNSSIIAQHKQKVLDNDDLVTGVIEDLNHDKSAFLHKVEPDTDIEIDDEHPQTIVHDPTIALRPGCYQKHGGFKGKGRCDDLLPRNSLGLLCGSLKSCYTSRVHPTSAIPPPYRLTTTSALHDIQRWINAPPTTALPTPSPSRAKDPFLHSPRFTPDDLRTAFRATISSIKDAHTSLAALVTYASRHPYFLPLQPDLLPEAELSYLDIPADETFATFSREKLVQELTEAVVEMDYLNEVEEGIKTGVLRRKVKLAKLGSWGEVEGLVEGGWVDWEWVDKECFFI